MIESGIYMHKFTQTHNAFCLVDFLSTETQSLFIYAIFITGVVFSFHGELPPLGKTASAIATTLAFCLVAH